MPNGQLLSKAITAIQEQQPARAIAILEKRLASHPVDSAAWHYLGIACAAAGNFIAAIPALNKSLELAPENTFFQENYLITLYNDQQYQEVVAFFQGKDNEWLQKPAIQLILASSQLKAGLLPEALKVALSLLERDRALVEAWRITGNVQRTLGQLSAAQSAFNQVLALEPAKPANYAMLAELYAR